MATLRSASLLAVLAGLAAGCGYGHLQTARPTPKGAIDFTAGWGFVYNKTIQMRREAEDGGSGVSVSNLPIVLNSRLGITDRQDIGLRMFMLGGLMADTKVNFLNPKSRWAVSGSVGFGAAADVSKKGAYLINLPLSLHASYDFKFGLTPYVALGYSFFWIYGRDADPLAGVAYLDRAGHGDHLVTAALGIKQRIGRRAAIFIEYNLWQPVVDDPGDFFSFERSHFFFIGLRVRGRLFGRPPHALQPTLPPPIHPMGVPVQPDPQPDPQPTPIAPPPPPPPPPAP